MSWATFSYLLFSDTTKVIQGFSVPWKVYLDSPVKPTESLSSKECGSKRKGLIIILYY